MLLTRGAGLGEALDSRRLRSRKACCSADSLVWSSTTTAWTRRRCRAQDARCCCQAAATMEGRLAARGAGRHGAMPDCCIAHRQSGIGSHSWQACKAAPAPGKREPGWGGSRKPWRTPERPALCTCQVVIHDVIGKDRQQ